MVRLLNILSQVIQRGSLAIILILHITHTYGQENPNYTDATTLINVWLEAQLDHEGIPAIMGVALHDQEIIWSGAFGRSNIEANIPADINTIGSIGSVSKLFTATAIMKLADEGQLSLNDPISDLLPEYQLKETYPDSGYVTIESLLTHSSGVSRDTDHSYWSGPDHSFPTKQDFIDNLSEMETSYPVGTDVLYSNVGYALLGLVIEKVSGLSYKEYMETQIFQPLGMNHSIVEMPESLYGNKHAVGYTVTNRNRKRERASFYQARALQPAAGISSSVTDLAKFAAWQFRLLDAEEKEILTPGALKSMFDVRATSKNGYSKRGLGYEVFTDASGVTWVMHGGMCPGYVAFIKMDISNKMAYAVLINANGEKALKYVNGIIDILSSVTPGSNQLTQPELSEYNGFFDLNPWNSEYYIGSWGSGLVALYLPTEDLQYALYFYKRKEHDVYELVNDRNEPVGEELVFYRNDEGEITKVKNDGNYHNRKE